ncbi:acetoin:2,6-dichlorophenolindophenol oxidoreductase subunit alpha [Paenibacillus baekrokdamisoli]|uniref:Acetoin:2,6-dichlorophenolindophenol oxidoreductase subunit alpha n=1 Tax=Paenibacillus baekrokdamisoli TaxID=1712516 RepID=A0A3G9IZB0_9BACL|nr:thiamine pyrophosphate-dependent dehydrogenase E1 component subunit alpha [Paenibacillus baekrokdamisoli]MBB3071778.1 pyruvate dehydrogenase E1 component alpha subunit [Paenibacillus baekrokdamisoli]BBH24240.1 acetoin:2,6-dichlorophenolindophenol oxidoreductase subunit alpha [Paenibacillus baekrokdamisoli]
MSEYMTKHVWNEASWNWDEDRVLQAWRLLNLIREFEEKSIEMYKEGLMGGSLHSYIGQEAVAAGMGMVMAEQDYMTMTYRGRGQALAKGADPFRLFAEMMGRIDGYCKGKGGPMHIASPELGILGANGIVGAGIPIAVGAAFTSKLKKLERVSVTFFGDGATNQGAFHEGLNLAAVFKLPVVFVCENNLYSEMTPIKESLLNEHIAERGAAYRIPSVIVDGNDIRAVYEVGQEAMARARAGGGPTFIEAKTYRLVGHMFGDSESYRERAEVESWRKKEPLTQFRELCRNRNLLSEESLSAVTEEIRTQIGDAYERARKASEPELEEIFTHVY